MAPFGPRVCPPANTCSLLVCVMSELETKTSTMASEMHFVLNFTLKVPFLGFVRCARVCSAFRELPGGSRAEVLVALFGLRLCLVKA